jgi:hypothetical protein
MGVAGGFEAFQKAADGLANGADLALFVARSSPHVFAGPGVNFIELGAGFGALYVGRVRVVRAVLLAAASTAK